MGCDRRREGANLGVNVEHPIVTNGILCVRGGDTALPRLLWDFLFFFGILCSTLKSVIITVVFDLLFCIFLWNYGVLNVVDRCQILYNFKFSCPSLSLGSSFGKLAWQRFL